MRRRHDVAALFPGERGRRHEAAPAIWEDMDGFQAATDKFKAGCRPQPLAAAPQDLDAFRAVVRPMAGELRRLP